MDHQKAAAELRIGELSRRVGVSEHVLRAWESRYGLLNPERSAGGYRLYSEDDQNRVRRMQAHLADGLAAAQAARAAIADEQPRSLAADDDAPPRLDLVDAPDAPDALRHALDEMDEPGAQAALDRMLTDLTLGTVLRERLMPYLFELGERWAQGTVSVAQGHFANHVIRGRLTSLARGWGDGRGPYALLACPPGEEHDLALIAFGIVLHRCGWRVGYLGVNTPIPDLIRMAPHLRPRYIVLAATTPERFTAVVPELSALAGMTPLALAGPGATKDLALAVGARLLTGDPVSAAEDLAGS